MTRSGNTDDPWLRGEAPVALGFVLERAGRVEETTAALHAALVALERKGNVVYPERVRRLLEAASGQTSSTRQGA